MELPIIAQRRFLGSRGPAVLHLQCCNDHVIVRELDKPLSPEDCRRIAEFVQRHAREVES